MLSKLIIHCISGLILRFERLLGCSHCIEIWAYDKSYPDHKSITPADYSNETNLLTDITATSRLLRLDNKFFFNDVWNFVGYVGHVSTCELSMHKAIHDGGFWLPQSLIDNCLIDGTCTWRYDPIFDIPTYVNLHLFDTRKEAEASFRSIQQKGGK